MMLAMEAIEAKADQGTTQHRLPVNQEWIDEAKKRIEPIIRERVQRLLSNATPNRIAAVVLLLSDNGQPVGDRITADES